MVKTDRDCLVYLVDGTLPIAYLPSTEGDTWDGISCRARLALGFDY